MNLVALVGNLATDPELRHTASERAVCTFRLAVSRPGGQEADFFTVVTWEKQAQVCAQYLRVGRRVAVDGRLHHSTWKAEDGSGRSKVEVVAHRVEMLGPPSKPSATPEVDLRSGDEPSSNEAVEGAFAIV